MDSTTIAYSVSFVSVLSILYWKMRKQVTDLLDEKQRGTEDAIKTIDYINSISITAFHEEKKKNNQIEDDIALIKEEEQKQIELLVQNHQEFKENLNKQFEQELEEHASQINGQFLQSMKDDFSELIMLRVQEQLKKSRSAKSPKEQFVLDMQRIQCG